MNRLITSAFGVAAGLLAAAWAIVGLGQIPNQTLAQADAALQAGEADKALALLGSIQDDGPASAEARNLECRVRYTLQQFDAAARECEDAVRMDGQNSNFHMWLGRAIGERASRSSFLTAFSQGKRVRQEFEEAVQLDPHNADALADLGSFYEEAPGFVGGGLEKAENIAQQLDRLDPPRADVLRGRIAESRKDYGTAEREFKLAVAVSHHPALEWTTLASFYRRRSRWNDLDSAIHSTIKAAAHDRLASIALYDGAGVLIEADRDPALAATMLESYLAGSYKTEEAPAFIAYIRLARLKKKLGDSAGAQQDQAAAFALAREYKPGQESRH